MNAYEQVAVAKSAFQQIQTLLAGALQGPQVRQAQAVVSQALMTLATPPTPFSPEPGPVGSHPEPGKEAP